MRMWHASFNVSPLKVCFESSHILIFTCCALKKKIEAKKCRPCRCRFPQKRKTRRKKVAFLLTTAKTFVRLKNTLLYWESRFFFPLKMMRCYTHTKTPWWCWCETTWCWVTPRRPPKFFKQKIIIIVALYSPTPCFTKDVYFSNHPTYYFYYYYCNNSFIPNCLWIELHFLSNWKKENKETPKKPK